VVGGEILLFSVFVSNRYVFFVFLHFCSKRGEHNNSHGMRWRVKLGNYIHMFECARLHENMGATNVLEIALCNLAEMLFNMHAAA